jgi:hypothetical protein
MLGVTGGNLPDIAKNRVAEPVPNCLNRPDIDADFSQPRGSANTEAVASKPELGACIAAQEPSQRIAVASSERAAILEGPQWTGSITSETEVNLHGLHQSRPLERTPGRH